MKNSHKSQRKSFKRVHRTQNVKVSKFTYFFRKKFFFEFPAPIHAMRMLFKKNLVKFAYSYVFAENLGRFRVQIFRPRISANTWECQNRKIFFLKIILMVPIGAEKCQKNISLEGDEKFLP